MSKLIRAFGMNQHLLRPKIKEIVSEITGWPIGRVIEHGDGRQDAVTAPPAVKVSFEQVENITGNHPNDLRRLIYERARTEGGMSHDEAVARLFPNRKVVA